MLLRIDGPFNFFWQWDLNRRILIEEQTCTQVHFTNGATQQALVQEIQRDDTGRYVNVPNILLQQAKPITAFLYLQNGESMTLHAQTFRVLPRSRPDNYVYTETEVLTWVALDERIKALEESGGVSPEEVAEMVADYLDENPPVETDPTVPAWAKQPEKPSYTAAEVGADPQGASTARVAEHNVSEDTHNDIRLLITGLTNRLNALANSDDTTLDQMAEVVAYIKNNKSLIDGITTGKVSVSDIIDNLTTRASNKPLSAAQGVALKALIDNIVSRRR